MAFVLTEYFGYLRRDPDEDGYNFWKAKLDRFSPTIQGAYGSYVSGRVGEYIDAEMVRAFLVSGEYRTRFGEQ